MSTFNTLRDHEELLAEKGYLNESFISGPQIGRWLSELREQFELYRFQAVASGQIQQFSSTLRGGYNEGLDSVSYRFHFSYNPQGDQLSIISLMAKMGRYTQPFFPPDSGDLPNADNAYKALMEQTTHEEHRFDLLNRLQAKPEKGKYDFLDAFDMNPDRHPLPGRL